MATYNLEVALDKANMKGLEEMPQYNCWVVLEIEGGEKKQSTTQNSTLTPEWEETFNFTITDPATQCLKVTGYVSDVEVGVGTFVLDKLFKGKSTYKGVAVRGGKMDLTLRAVDFGPSEEDVVEEGGDDWMDMLGADGMAAAEEEEEAKPAEAAGGAAGATGGPIGEGEFTLEVALDKANMKGLEEMPSYNCWVVLELEGGGKVQSETQKSTLTPEWEALFTFKVKDPETQRLIVTGYVSDVEVGAGTFVLDKLFKGKSTYKGVAVRGGKMDLTLRAVDFGASEEDVAEEGGDDWMNML